MNSPVFTIRVKPYIGESLWSYLLRLASKNGIEFYSTVKNIKGRRLRIEAAELEMMDNSPDSIVDVGHLSKMTSLPEEQLLRMTMHYVFATFEEPKDISTSRLLNGMLRDHFCYCPHCLKEKPYFRLIWKAENMQACQTHGTPLLDKCLHCHQNIKFHEVTDIERCPRCEKLLHAPSEWNPDTYSKGSHKNFLYWAMLIHSSQLARDVKQVSLKLLYLLNNKENVYQQKNIHGKLGKTSLSNLVQYARGKFPEKRVLHLAQVFSILQKHRMTMKDFLAMKVPEEFAKSIEPREVIPLPEQVACQAPWCSSHNMTGTLVITGATIIEDSRGKVLYHCSSCNACGCKYAISQSGEIRERTSFIKAHELVKGTDLEIWDPAKLRQMTGMAREKLRDCLAYFSVREIQPWANWLPVQAEAQLVKRFVAAVQSGKVINEIRAWECWKGHTHFLVHRYQPDVIYALIQPKQKQTKRQQDVADGKDRIPSIINLLMENDEDITIPKVASLLDVNRETLRRWGCTELIATAKEEQRKKRIARFKETIPPRADEYFQTCAERKIKSDELYQFLGVARSKLSLLAPEYTAEFAERLREHNRDIWREVDRPRTVELYECGP